MHRLELLTLLILGAGCATPQPQHFALLPVVPTQPSRAITLRVVDLRTSFPSGQQAEAITGDEIKLVVQNRLEVELARIGVMNGVGEVLSVEILDFAWDWKRVGFIALAATASALFRMRVTFGNESAYFVGQRTDRGPGASSLPLIADQLELALDDAIKTFGESQLVACVRHAEPCRAP